MYAPGAAIRAYDRSHGQQILNYIQYFLVAVSGATGPPRATRPRRVFAALACSARAAIGAPTAARRWHDGARRHADRRPRLYLNFKWGTRSLHRRGVALEHEVRERALLLRRSFAAWGVWVGIGLAALMEAPLARRRWGLGARAARRLIHLLGNRLMASRAGETMARDYARDVLESWTVRPDHHDGDNDTFPLWHAQEVEASGGT